MAPERRPLLAADGGSQADQYKELIFAKLSCFLMFLIFRRLRADDSLRSRRNMAHSASSPLEAQLDVCVV